MSTAMSPMSPRSLNLKVFHHHQLIEHKRLTADVIKIGKLQSSHVCLSDDSVARMHAVIEVAGSDVRVIDLGSATGTLLNARRVEKNAALGHGDVLQFGPYRVEVELADAPVTAAVARRPLMEIDPSTVEVRDGRTVTEVTALFGDTIVDVQHVGQVRPRRATAPVFVALGGAMLLGGGTFFAADVAQDWDGYRARAEAAHDAGRPLPLAPGTGFGSLGIAIAFLGLVPLGIGAVRMRDVGLTDYTIGEGHDAALHVSSRGLPDGRAFPLVRGSQGGAILNFTPEMTGDVTIEGRELTLAELAQSGRAMHEGSSHALALPDGARCRIKHAGLTFIVKSVAPGRVVAQRSEADKPFWLYNGVSLATIGSLLVLTHLLPDEALAIGLDDARAENRFVGYMNRPDETPEPEHTVETDTRDEAGGSGQRHVGDEGKMGKPTSKQKAGLYAMKGPKDATPQMARNFDPDLAARDAGVLGMIHMESGHFLASPFSHAFAVGNDDADVWGGLTGTEIGEAFGVGGLGLVGTGRSGGGTAEGTIGYGNVGLIGKSAGGGKNAGYGRGTGTGFGPRRGSGVPTIRQPKATISSGLDKDVVRRIVRNHINEVRYCYNQGLVRDPNLAGRVAVQFTIGPTGKVPAAVVQESSLGDRSAANCIAAAVKRWSFPKPEGGGNVLVTYPFVLAPG